MAIPILILKHIYVYKGFDFLFSAFLFRDMWILLSKGNYSLNLMLWNGLQAWKLYVPWKCVILKLCQMGYGKKSHKSFFRKEDNYKNRNTFFPLKDRSQLISKVLLARFRRFKKVSKSNAFALIELTVLQLLTPKERIRISLVPKNPVTSCSTQ